VGMNADVGAFYLLFTVSVVIGGDVGAYFVGRRYGRRKLAPRVSPGKTVEGAVGAIGAGLVIMHSLGAPADLHAPRQYGDVASDVRDFLERQARAAESHGVPRERIAIDPGIGFAKNAAHSLEVLRRLNELHALGRPLLVGPSRKSFIGKAPEGPASERQFGTAAAVAACVLAGAHVVRVHDVREMAQVVRVCDAILGSAA